MIQEKKKKYDVFSKEELKAIHKALYDNRRKYIEIKGTKCEIFEHSKLKQVKFNSTIFSKFVDNQVNTEVKATYVIKPKAPIYHWNVVDDNNVYDNKFEFRKAVKRNQNA